MHIERDHDEILHDTIGILIMTILEKIKDLGRQYLVKNSREDHQDLCATWIRDLSDISNVLENLAHSTEHEFLDIGAKLQEFYTRSKGMSEMSTQVVDLMTGDEISSSTQGLAHILQALEDHLGRSEEHFAGISSILQQYLKTLARTGSQLEDFKMLVLNLSMLGFFTRVENAHVFSNDTGFASLTDDVKKLSERIKEKSSQIKSRSKELIDMIHQALLEVSDSKKNQRNQARSMFDHTVSNHEILAKKNDTAMLSAKLISTKSQEITQSIGDIVSSIQFHDITRQQIEHVKEVLDHLINAVDSGEHSFPELAAMINKICSLQIEQLNQSRKDLTTAVEKIFKNLENLTASVAMILEEAQQVAWASDIEGLSFMENIDSGIASVITCLDENSREQMRLTETMTSLSDMVSEMSVFIQEIELMGQNLQLIALNARIKAAHIGHEGAALDTISGGIYDLSKNSQGHTKNLSEMLGGIVDVAKGFDTDIAEIQHTQEEEVQEMMDNLQGIIDSLHGVNNNVLTVITDMNSLGESLMADISTSIGDIRIQEKIEAVIDKACNAMDTVLSEASKALPEEALGDENVYLKHLDTIYTMKSERDIHMRHQKNNNEADTISNGDTGDSSEGLGDNVELF
ncbi:MAG: methyl-accepting chemotaxis protein [Deltaproteobacteria bacterium]|nr:methyl-accepting chemotaxis protein [Deltaproteobacteria bacterium]